MKNSNAWTVCATALLGLTGALQAGAATLVPGGGVGSQAWSAAGSPYVIQGDIFNSPGQTLLLGHGTIVHLAGTDSLFGGYDASHVEIAIAGSLIFDATTSFPVQMVPEAGGGPASWWGMRVESGGALQAAPSTQITGTLYLLNGSSFSGYGVSLNGDLALGNSVNFRGGLPGAAVPAGTTYTIFDLAPGHTVSGTFTGLPEGAEFDVGANRFAITYHGGSGNDVLAQAVPEPPAHVLTLAGLSLLALLARRRHGVPPGILSSPRMSARRNVQGGPRAATSIAASQEAS